MNNVVDTPWTLAAAVVLAVLSVVLGVSLLTVRRRYSRQGATARWDPLTGLGNRARLVEAADRALTDLGRLDGDGRYGPALLMLDLDGFKDVNDTLGHEAGDTVLTQVAARLEAAVGGEGHVVRMGGDEFAVLVERPVTAAQASLVGKQMLAALGAGGFEAQGVHLEVRASVGVAIAPSSGRELAELLRGADAAMYEAKRTRAGVCVHTPALSPESPDGLATLSMLRGAMDAGHLELYYQPIIDAATTDVNGFEALLRWRHPERGLLLPAEFVPLAERTALIRPLTRWVLLTALRQADQWRSEGLEVTMSVNISAAMLERGLLGIVDEALARSRWPASRLVLELTETAIADNSTEALSVVSDLRARGAQISIDDFGAGFTGLSQLRGLDIQHLKIDRQFVTNLSSEPVDEAIVGALVDLGHRLGVKTVAEGVEDAAAAALLTMLGCDELQGYLLSRPLPAADVLPWWRDWSSRHRRRGRSPIGLT